MNRLSTVVLALAVLGAADVACGQTLSERIAAVKMKRAKLYS